MEEPSTERPPSRCGRCEKNKTDDGKTDDDGPEGGPDDGAAGEVQPDDSLSFATDPPATENPVVNVSFQKFQNTMIKMMMHVNETGSARIESMSDQRSTKHFWSVDSWPRH